MTIDERLEGQYRMERRKIKHAIIDVPQMVNRIKFLDSECFKPYFEWNTILNEQFRVGYYCVFIS